MNQEYIPVNILNEFSDINDIEKLNNFFKENGWQLVKTINETDSKVYYQLYFGDGVQVDNMYEYGFSHLLNKEDTSNILERFINYKFKENYRYYVYDFLIGQWILTIDTEDKKYRIDDVNIHGQCFTLDRDWTKVTNALVNRAISSNEYAIDRYIEEHFNQDKPNYSVRYNDKSLLFKSNNYDDCILFLTKFYKENHNYSNNKNFDYYKKFLSDSSKFIDLNISENEEEMEMEYE